MSFLSWIDFDEADRQRARRIMALFEESEARDELGMGSIRDSIADHLFPGVTTLHTRLRYVLFVPWIFNALEESGSGAEAFERHRRDLEVALTRSLLHGHELTGVIGRVAKDRLRRFPSSIYWEALRLWGIRRLDGLPEDMRLGSHAIWAADLPSAPDGWLKRVTFDLTQEEGDFIVDRLVNSQPKSLLSHLANARYTVDCEYVWEHPNLASFPQPAKTIVEHARVFSVVMLGASLLYNLMLSHKREKQDWIDRYNHEISQWASDTFDQKDAERWSLQDFWNQVRHPNHRIRRGARRFVEDWHQLAVQYGGEISGREDACDLVMGREQMLKRAKSRFTNSSALDRWQGRSGAGRLNFRWPTAKRHLQDIANANA